MSVTEGIQSSIRKGARVIKVRENPFSFDTYLSLESGVREWLVPMHWTNGTQYVCNADWFVCSELENQPPLS